jgi:peptidoglycan hydrolase-like amidase
MHIYLEKTPLKRGIKMLSSEVIPQAEPSISVGIILPEDNYSTISIQIPTEPLYLLKDSNGETIHLKAKDKIDFRLLNSGFLIFINDEERGKSEEWIISPVVETYEVKSKSGIEVKDVISGRNFHWKKYINVFLPGKVKVKKYGDSLILINDLPFEQYLMCVATSEMGAECPSALIESQTIVARSWMLANVEKKHRDIDVDVCNDDCCQRYQGTTFLTGKSIQGALNTTGKVVMYKNKICDTRYSKSCGGVVESFESVWDGESIPYLKSFPDAPSGFSHSALPLNSEESVKRWISDVPKTFCSPSYISEEKLKQYLGSVDELGKYFRWEFKYSQFELTNLLNNKLNLNAKAIKKIEPLERGYSGRLKKLRILYLGKNGSECYKTIENQYNIRDCFHKSFLYSSAFIVQEKNEENDIPSGFTLRGAGWGHGVGYCQIGALGMALSGYSSEEIVKHYFPGTILKKLY